MKRSASSKSVTVAADRSHSPMLRLIPLCIANPVPPRPRPPEPGGSTDQRGFYAISRSVSAGCRARPGLNCDEIRETTYECGEPGGVPEAAGVAPIGFAPHELTL